MKSIFIPKLVTPYKYEKKMYNLSSTKPDEYFRESPIFLKRISTATPSTFHQRSSLFPVGERPLTRFSETPTWTDSVPWTERRLVLDLATGDVSMFSSAKPR